MDSLYPSPAPSLRHVDPFTLLVAVMLSAQSTDKRVNEVTPGLFQLAATPRQMVALGHRAVEECVRPVGLAPTKARNIVALSMLLVEKHEGEVPREMEVLESLPGVGHKTASVISAQAFDRPAFPVDTHVLRLAWRWGLSSARNVVTTEEELKKLFAVESWKKRHLQMISFGRDHCPARAHVPKACPICAWAMLPDREERIGRDTTLSSSKRR